MAPLAGVPTHLDKLDLRAHRDPEALRAQYKVGWALGRDGLGCAECVVPCGTVLG